MYSNPDEVAPRCFSNDVSYFVYLDNRFDGDAMTWRHGRYHAVRIAISRPSSMTAVGRGCVETRLRSH